MTSPRAVVRPYGDAAVLVEPAEPGTTLAWYAAARSALETGRLPGVVDLVPAAASLLVRLDRSRATVGQATAALRALHVASVPPPPGRTVRLAVRYDGPDLAEVASGLGWTTDRLVAEHTARTWRSAFTGFVPGFAYLEPDRAWPTVPRRADPRTSVPAGALGLADRYSGVYPRATPGGWRLVGTAETPVWELAQDPPALLAPGTVVRFVPVR